MHGFQLFSVGWSIEDMILTSLYYSYISNFGA